MISRLRFSELASRPSRADRYVFIRYAILRNSPVCGATGSRMTDCGHQQSNGNAPDDGFCPIKILVLAAMMRPPEAWVQRTDTIGSLWRRARSYAARLFGTVDASNPK